MVFLRSRLWIPVILICLFTVGFLTASPQPNLPAGQTQAATAESNLSVEQMRQFLLTAKVINFKQTKKGITNPYRLTLSDGKITHDGGFQAIDESKSSADMGPRGTELNFRDSYHYNIAAYELAKLLGLEQMMPVTVERKWDGKTGSLTWWLKVKMDEGERKKQKIEPPNPEAWNNQMHRMRVFAQLVYDTDRNLTNVLIGENWELYMIDFTRAFRLHPTLENAKNLERGDRQLLEKLRQLDAAEVERKTKPHLRKPEIKALMARRDKIVAYFQQLVTEKGEKAVLY